MQQPAPVLQAPPVPQAAPVSDDQTAGHAPWPPKAPGRSSRFYAVIAGVALAALVGAVVVELVTETHHDSSAVPNAVTPAQHNAKYDASTKADIRNAATAEETYFTDNQTYTTSGTGAEGSNTGPLRGYTRSEGSVSITFSLFGTQSYMIVAVSKSGRPFCFNSAKSGAGVVPGNAC